MIGNVTKKRKKYSASDLRENLKKVLQNVNDAPFSSQNESRIDSQQTYIKESHYQTSEEEEKQH
jgi:hypothetical protein